MFCVPIINFMLVTQMLCVPGRSADHLFILIHTYPVDLHCGHSADWLIEPA
jgi:hypothetical protein